MNSFHQNLLGRKVARSGEASAYIIIGVYLNAMSCPHLILEGAQCGYVSEIAVDKMTGCGFRLEPEEVVRA